MCEGKHPDRAHGDESRKSQPLKWEQVSENCGEVHLEPSVTQMTQASIQPDGVQSCSSSADHTGPALGTAHHGMMCIQSPSHEAAAWRKSKTDVPSVNVIDEIS